MCLLKPVKSASLFVIGTVTEDQVKKQCAPSLLSGGGEHPEGVQPTSYHERLNANQQCTWSTVFVTCLERVSAQTRDVLLVLGSTPSGDFSRVGG